MDEIRVILVWHVVRPYPAVGGFLEDEATYWLRRYVAKHRGNHLDIVAKKKKAGGVWWKQ